MTDTFIVAAVVGVNLWLAWHAVKGLRIAFGVKNRVPEDASGQDIPFPPDLSLNAQELSRLGFELLGPVQLRIPTRLKPETTWVFLNSDRTIMAEITRFLVGFSTSYGDKWNEIVYFPTGERIRGKNYRTDFVETSLQDAYEAHLKKVQEVPKEMGSPNVVHSIAEYIRLEIIWRKILGSRLQRNFILFDLLVLGSAAYSLAVILFFMAFSGWLDYLAMGVLPRLQPVLICLLPAVLVMAGRMIINVRIWNRIKKAGGRLAG